MIKAFISREFAVEKKYRFGFVVKTAGILFQLAIFFFIGRMVTDYAYFPFVFIGLVFSRFFQFWMNVFSENIRMEQYWGTAETLFLSPSRPVNVALISASGKFLFLLFELALYAAAGAAVFHLHVPPPAVVAGMLPFIIIQSVLFAGLGLAAAAFVLYLKRGDPVGFLVTSAFDLLSGVYFPAEFLPRPLRTLSALLPTTVSLDAWRALLLGGAMPSASSASAQVLWALAAAAIGVLCFNFAFKKVRRDGELGSY
jgi:ABC-2 type transport system permease protein